MSDFLSADAASNSSNSPSTNNEPQTADISAMAGDHPNPDPGKRGSGEAPLRLVETAFLASTASLIWLVNYYFPLGPLLRVFFPIPIALVYLRWGNRAAWMAALVSGLLLSVLMGPTRSILYVIPFGVMGVALGGLWRRKASWSLSISVGALIGTVGFFFRFWLLSALVGQDLWVYVTAQVTEMVEWVFVKLGWLNVPSLNTIGAIAAGMILVNNIVYLFVVHLVALLLLDRLGNPIPRPPHWVQLLIDYEE
ncbi:MULTISPECIES: DUF2232 domain-containing protein [unclassified Microcoleus]|uniref:DUF2232 domain-containing protein n=1 Tax=unclassified Microcoleus TaxID=2642155 RepID=UPI002FD40B85